MSTTQQLNLPALFKPKWVCFYIHNTPSENFELLLFISKLSQEVIQRKYAERFILYKGGDSDEIIFLTYETDHFSCESKLKPFIQSSFKAFYERNTQLAIDLGSVKDNKYFVFKELNIDVEENYLHYPISIGGWNVFNTITKDLMYGLSNITATYISDAESDWTMEVSIQKQIPLFFILLDSFEISKEDYAVFLDWYWQRTLATVAFPDAKIDKNELFNTFITNVENNYTNQKDFFVAYIDYILDNIDSGNDFEDDEQLAVWKKYCTTASTLLDKTLEANEFVVAETETGQNVKWCYLEVILHSINASLGIPYVYAFNLIYSIRQGYNELSPYGQSSLSNSNS